MTRDEAVERKGDLERRAPLLLEIILILTFSQSTGTRDRAQTRRY
jgi:hypothetical protein